MVAMPNEDMRELMALAWDNFWCHGRDRKFAARFTYEEEGHRYPQIGGREIYENLRRGRYKPEEPNYSRYHACICQLADLADLAGDEPVQPLIAFASDAELERYMLFHKRLAKRYGWSWLLGNDRP
jgi:hypothetical protein